MQSNLSNYETGRLTFTKKANANFTNEFKQRIIDIFKYFPELHNEIVLVGWIAPHGWARGSCWCSKASTIKPLKINLQPKKGNLTKPHEFKLRFKAKKKEKFQ